QTKLDLRIPSSRLEESDTALRLWLALQVSPSRSPRACSQKIAFFCSRACSLASSSEDSQLTSLVSKATFFSTRSPGRRAFLADSAFLAFFWPSAGWHQRAQSASSAVTTHLRTAGTSAGGLGRRELVPMKPARGAKVPRRLTQRSGTRGLRRPV